MFGGAPIKRKPAVKLVGYLFDEKMTWSGMIEANAKKARQRIGMLSRLRHLLDDRNMKTMYCTFIRPILEYGSVQYMGAAPTHLGRLDSVQRMAERIGHFEVEPLQSRREAAAMSFTLKLMDGNGRGVLNAMAPVVVEVPLSKKRCRHSATGTQLQSRSKVNSLDSFKRSYLGSIHNIWAKMPQEIIRDGREKGWIKITKRSKEFLMGKIKSVSCKKKKVDETQVVKVDRTNIETKN